MKKLLALVLALVMTMSLATVSTNAAFDDADSINYKEAVDVMNAIGVLEGDGTGKFNPSGILNREQAAKIISTLLLGKTVAGKLTVDSVKFADVKATDWAAPYIAYCAANGIVVGDGTNFYPTTKLTGHAFAKMLLVAIGADGNYTGADWAINVAVDVQKYGLDANLSSLVLSNELTREEAAQMALNAALYTKTGKTYLVDGQYSFDNMTDALLYAAILDAKVEVVSGKDTLLNTVFGVTQIDGEDSFGRPAVNYLNAKNKVLVQVVEEPDFTFTGANYKANLYNSGKALADYAKYTQTVVYNGGEDSKVAKTPYQILGSNVELYINNNAKTIKVIVTEGYFTEVTRKTTSLSTGVTTMNLKVYEAGYYLGNANSYKTLTINSKDNKDEYALVADLAKNDVFVGFYNPGWEDTNALIAVDTDVEAVEATVKTSKFSGTYNGYFMTTDGDKLTFANEYSQAAVKTGSTGTFYLYNGYVMHFDAATTSVTINDVFYVAKTWSIPGGQNEYGEVLGETWYAQIINLDGTVENIVINKASAAVTGLATAKYDSNNEVNVLSAWNGNSTYTVDTIKAGTEIKKNVVKSDNNLNVRLDSDTLNIVANGKFGSKLQVKTSNGILNAKLADDAIVIGKKSGSNLTAAYVIVAKAESIAVDGTMVYVLTEKLYADTETSDGTPVYIVNVYDLEGANDTLYVTDTTNLVDGWHTYTVKDEVATLTRYSTAVKDGVGVASGNIDAYSFYNDLLTFDCVVDLDISDAVVVDNCRSDVETVAALFETIEAGWTVTIDLYTNDGFVMIVINDVFEA